MLSEVPPLTYRPPWAGSKKFTEQAEVSHLQLVPIEDLANISCIVSAGERSGTQGIESSALNLSLECLSAIPLWLWHLPLQTGPSPLILDSHTHLITPYFHLVFSSKPAVPILVSTTPSFQMFLPSKPKILNLLHVKPLSKLGWLYLQNVSKIWSLLTSWASPTTSTHLDYILIGLPAHSLFLLVFSLPAAIEPFIT